MSAPTVVIADDQASFRKRATEVLTSRGYRVLQAADGVQALALCRTEQPDVILLDIVMPDMDGVTMCKTLRQDSSIPYIPVIYYSRRERVEDRVAALRAGGDDFVSKDIDDEELVARVEVAVRIRALIAAGSTRGRPAAAADLESNLAAAFRRAQEVSEPLSLLLVEPPPDTSDVNADELVELLATCCRGDDVVGTDQGAGAVAILAGAHFGGALATAERVWRSMPPRDDFVGVTIGVACYPNREVSSAAELLRFGRAALDRARAEGPAHICLYQHQAYLFRPD